MNTPITLATLHQATAQQVFDQVAKHLLTQNQKSKLDDKCQYRGLNNTKCAAGCLISDEEYQPHFEGKIWVQMITADYAPEEHSALIDTLQSLHDCCEPEEWPSKLQDVATEFKLTYTQQQ